VRHRFGGGKMAAVVVMSRARLATHREKSDGVPRLQYLYGGVSKNPLTAAWKNSNKYKARTILIRCTI
jgi:hypothetical protein